jgi:hypothetical protein
MKTSIDKSKLSEEPNIPVLGVDKNEIKILSSIEKSKPNIEKSKVNLCLKTDKKKRNKASFSSSTEEKKRKKAEILFELKQS